jgi:hypothetical protein
VKLTLAEQNHAKFVVGAQAGHGSQHRNSGFFQIALVNNSFINLLRPQKMIDTV